MGYQILQGNIVEPLTFEMRLLAGGLAPGLAPLPAVYLSKAGAPFVPALGAVSEVGNGVYRVEPHAGDADVIGGLILYATQITCTPTIDLDFEVIPVPAPPAPPLPGDAIRVTALSAMRGALQLLGKQAAGESLAPEIAAEMLPVLNEMIDNWKTQRLLVPQLIRVEYILTAGKTSYTVGPGGDIDTERPYSIRYALVKDAGNPDYERPIGVRNEEAHAVRGFKTVTGLSHVNEVYYQPTAQLGTLHVPAASAGSTLVLYLLGGLPRFDDLTTEYVLMPGYAKAIRYNLAIDFAPIFGAEVSSLIYEQAQSSKGDVKRLNQRHGVLANYFTAGFGDYDIYGDQPK